MKKWIFAILLFVPIKWVAASKPLPIENGHCIVPYHPIRWQTIYCMARVGTDDLLAVEEKCMALTPPDTVRTVCDQNAYWKEKWCGIVWEGLHARSAAACLADRTNVPRGVAEGF